MLVQCPSCHITYNVADNLIKVPNPTFRCSHCKHIFALGLNPEASPNLETTPRPTPPTPREGEEERELSFSFPPAKKKEEKEEPLSSIPDPQPPFSRQESEDEWSMASPSPPEEENFPIPQENHAPAMDSATRTEAEPEAEWQVSSPLLDEGPTEALDRFRERPVSTVPYISLLGALLLIYSLATLTFQAQPRTVEAFIRAVPWLGPTVLKNSHLRHGLSFQSLSSGFQTIQGNREVFVVSGLIVNHNPVSVREVRVEGQTFNAQGREIERQEISVGNAISSRILRDLTVQEISILQRLNPQKRFEIAPDGPASFVIVFLKPSSEVKDFSCRVLSAEGI